MDFIFEALTEFKNNVVTIMKDIDNPFVVLLDVLMMTFIIYKGAKFIRGTRTEQLFKGIIFLVIATMIATRFEITMLSFFLNKVFEFSIVILVIIFQPEIRRGLEQMGRSKISVFSKNSDNYAGDLDFVQAIDQVVKASMNLSKTHTGALIIFERESLLDEIIKTGTLVEAKVTSQLLCNIFYPKTPLHDGAVIIRNARVISAASILPLTSSNNVNKDLGTRHRAAIGVSEANDCIALTVSEETGVISVSVNGLISRGFDDETLKEELIKHLIDDKNIDRSLSTKIKKFTRKVKPGKKIEKGDENEQKK